MKKTLTLCILFSVFLFSKDYRKHTETIEVINTLVDKYGFEKGELKKLFADVNVQKSALRVFLPRKKHPKKEGTSQKVEPRKGTKPKPNYGSWERYTRLKLNKSRIDGGIAFVQKYKKTFNAVEKKYGVPKEYIAAIIGVESSYGEDVGTYPVFDTLSTLAFEKNRRNGFFKKELIKFIHLSKTEKFNPKNVYGSYAGAIGLGQFMPSNYEAYGVDFNGDGRITLQKQEDAIASIGNYLKQNRWKRGEPVAVRVRYDGMRFDKYKTGYTKTYDRKALKGIRPKEPWAYDAKVRLIKLSRKHYDELWYGAKNFFVITRYNHSSYYAMTVHQLALKIKEGVEK